MQISGTLPRCFGDLADLSVIGIAQNYLEGEIPDTFDSLTSLKTIILSSNRFRCNTPTLDLALALGLGRFEGVTYPAMLDLANTLLDTANIPISVFNDRLSRIVPKVNNVVLLFTGNGMLKTDASAIAGDTKDTAPNAVRQDAILQGTLVHTA